MNVEYRTDIEIEENQNRVRELNLGLGDCPIPINCEALISSLKGFHTHLESRILDLAEDRTVQCQYEIFQNIITEYITAISQGLPVKSEIKMRISIPNEE